MEFYFDHEKLEVYRIAIQFVAWSEILLEDCKGKAASAKKHLDEASSEECRTAILELASFRRH